MIIEKAEIMDMEEILKLQKHAFYNEGVYCNDMNIAPLAETLDQIRLEYSRQLFLKATISQNEIVGSVRAYMKDGTVYIGRLIVREDFQNMGLGKALMHQIEREFKEAKRFELFTGKHNKKTNHFYQQLGYKVIREEKVTKILTLLYYEKNN